MSSNAKALEPTALIRECLESTATEWGSSRGSLWRQCRRAHHLKYIQKLERVWGASEPEEIWGEPQKPDASSLVLEAAPVYYSIGQLLHAGLHYAALGALNNQESNPTDVTDYILANAADYTQHTETAALEAERLLNAYVAHYGLANAGWPLGVHVEAAELLLEDHETFVVPETRRADLILRMGGKDGSLMVVDHKTRSQKVPDGSSYHTRESYIRGLASKPAFLGQSYLAMKHYKLSEPPPVMLNCIIKTKIPKFDRVVIRFTKEQIENWLEERACEAEEQRADESGWRVRGMLPVANLDNCAPEIGRPCEYFKYCHGSLQERKLHYKENEAK